MPTKVLAFGSGDCGQLGLGEDVTELERPRSISFFDDKDISIISAGGLHNLALSSSGILYSWGCNDEKALGHDAPEWCIGVVNLPLLPSEKIVSITCGDSISAAVTSEGRVYSWGTFRDSQGVLGFSPSNTQLQVTPVLLDTNHMRVVDIAAGANHLVAIAGEARDVLISWGSGEQGQLGRRILMRHKINGLRPVNVTPKKRILSQYGLTTGSYSKIACGSYHSLAVTSSPSSSSILAWGLNNYGQLGRGDSFELQMLPRPVAIPEGCDAIDVSAGEHHSLALLSDGRIFAWGRGDSGQLGISFDFNSSSHAPLQVGGPTFFEAPVQMIVSGSNHNLAVDSNQNLYSWGFGAMGQLGTGSEEDLHVPKRLMFQKALSSLPGFRIKQIQAGGQHSLLLIEHD